jgi:C-terminal binding-module, SLH-like, of glucodextranase
VRPWALLLLSCCWCGTSAAAAPGLVVFEQDDPAGDADGPGTYSNPTDADLQGAHFDLRKFTVRVEGDDVVLEVTLGEVIRPPGSNWRTNRTPVELKNSLFLQNVDIYVDTAPASTAGHSQSIPGRRVQFEAGRTWKRAVVMTPLPGYVASIVSSAFGDAAKQSVTVPPLTSRGRTVIARVPQAFFGGKPKPEWGWSVQVSGAAWEHSFVVVDRIKGTEAPDALTMPVSTTAERWMFGGAKLGRSHPQVVDLLVPPGQDQHQVLSSFDNEKVELARVPFVYGKPPPPLPPLPAPSPLPGSPPSLVPGPPPTPPLTAPVPDGWTVVDVQGELFSVSGPTEGLSPMMFGEVLTGDGGVGARVVVVQVLPNGLLASAVDHKERIGRGAKVRFSVKPKE